MNLAYIPSPTFSKFEIGPFTIHMYAICILIGICVAVWILATRWKRYGGTFDQILDTTLVTVPCALVGARLYHCITTPADYFPPTGNLINILKVWEGGMAIFGGISVGTLVAFLWCRHKHYPFAIFADAIAPASLWPKKSIGRLLATGSTKSFLRLAHHVAVGPEANDADAIGKSEICYSGARAMPGLQDHAVPAPDVPVRDDLEPRLRRAHHLPRLQACRPAWRPASSSPCT